MPELPVGTITYLLTDVEGSTRLWEQDPAAMRRALACHDALLAAGIGRHGGIVVKSRGEGDSFFAVFAHASDAVAAACDLQRTLQAEAWPTDMPLRVRMGVHTGEAELRDQDYFGAAVNRCARLRAAAHGGQILLSQPTYELVRDAPPAGTSLVPLGKHRLKDLIRPERIFQLAVPDLPTDFPPLRTLDTRPHNLPVQRNPLIGREREMAAAEQLVLRDDVGLLTLTGPGGIGKTRLGLQIGAELIDHYEDGVFFVALAPISDPGLIASTIARTLGVREVGGRSLVDSLKDSLRAKEQLLVLDNFEQLLPAAPLIAELLAACPRLKLLVTSRAALQITPEHEFPVPPLALPDLRRPPVAEALVQYAAVALFVERATAIKPDFAVTNDNALAVAEICARLDGLPLAIELAAARIRLLAPRAMLARLEHRLALLTGGPRDLPARQQTLRRTIAWSYDLLDHAEQRLFRRLAIFVGGCSLEAAEAVCNADGDLGIDLLDGAGSLVAKSLLWQDAGADGEPRFGMLETIREYGLEQLEASGELEKLSRQHGSYFLDRAQEARPQLMSAEQLVWLDRLERDHDNLRAVLARSRDGVLDADIGLRLAAGVWWFWHHHSYLGEGRRWLEGVLTAPANLQPTAARAEALIGAGVLAFNQSDNVAARARLEEALAIGSQLGDRRVVAAALTYLATLAANQDMDLDRAERLHMESAAICREVGDIWGLAINISRLGVVARLRGDYAAARARGEEGVALFRETGDRFGLGHSLLGLGFAALQEGDAARAMAHLQAALAPLQQLGMGWFISRALVGLASVACAQGDYERAGRLFGAEEANRESIGAPIYIADRAVYERALSTVRSSLDGDRFAATWQEGRTMSLEQAIAYALEEAAPA